MRDNLVRSLIDGDDFLGTFPVAPVGGAVALLDAEMSELQLQEWLRDQRILADDRVFIVSLRGAATTFDILNAEVRTQWADRLREVGTEYVILDCLRPVLDAIGLDENHDVGRFLVALDALLREADIGEALVVHHMGHTSERARGDSRLRDWPDVEWQLVRQDGPNSVRFFKAFGRDVDHPESQLAYEPTSRRLTVCGGSRKDAAVQAVLKDVLDVLDETPKPLSVRAFEAAAIRRGVPRKAARTAIEHGVRTGAISTTSGPRGAILHQRASQTDTSVPLCRTVPTDESI